MRTHSCLVSLALSAAIGKADFLWPYQTFKTVDAHPPALNISKHANPTGGYLFFAPDGSPANNPQIAPLIMDMDGELVWNGPSQHAFNFGVQSYQGEQVLVGWNGSVFREPVGRGNGEVFIWNKHYEVVTKVTLPGNFAELIPGARYPSNIDLHEHVVTPEGTMLVCAYNVTQTDLTSVGGPHDGWVAEAQIYEIDIATNNVLFTWKSLDHLDRLPLNASVYLLGSEGQDGKNQSNAWGYFHHNSIEPFSDGYIISSRYLASAIAIDKSGNVLWRLSGIDGADFTLGPGADFRYQHDIRVVGEKRGRYGKTTTALTLELHDNHNAPLDKNTVPTSGKILDVDLVSKHVTLRKRFIDESNPLFATAQGSHRVMDNSNIFVGNGYIPVLQEFSPDGRILSTIQFGPAPARPEGGLFSPLPANVTLSYRGFKQHWEGCPKTKPAVVAQAGTAGSISVYVSWNGATEVVGWEVYGGDSDGYGKLSFIKAVKRDGFETEVRLKRAVNKVQVKPVLRPGTQKDCGKGVVSDVVTVSSDSRT